MPETYAFKKQHRNMHTLTPAFKKGGEKMQWKYFFYSRISCKVLFYPFVKHTFGWLSFICFVLFCCKQSSH